MSKQRRGNGSCGNGNQPQYIPYMMGGSHGYTLSKMPQGQSMSGAQCYPAQRDPQPQYGSRRTPACNFDCNATVRECMYWPASLNRAAQQQQSSMSSMPATTYQNYQPATSGGGAGDQMFCTSPPKVYMSSPGQKGPIATGLQNIPISVAPLGTDPSSLIKPMEPLTVRVQAPADLFAGDPNQPKTISISPAQLYGGRGGGR